MKEADFSANDKELLAGILSLYSPEYIDSVYIEDYDGKKFIIPIEYKEIIDEEAEDFFYESSRIPELSSPVCVTNIGGEWILD
jgi:hypothetical protein